MIYFFFLYFFVTQIAHAYTLRLAHTILYSITVIVLGSSVFLKVVIINRKIKIKVFSP